MMEGRSLNRIVMSARTWIGTPYRHLHSTRGQGCDCLGLIRGVWRDVIGEEPTEPPVYTPFWGEAYAEERLLGAAQAFLVPRDLDQMRPGDVLIFRIYKNAAAKHCGIYTGNGRMIHAYQGQREVSEHTMGHYWRNRCVAAFSYPLCQGI